MNTLMKRFFLPVLAIFLVQHSFAQNGAPDLKSLSAPFKKIPKPKLMILGTFHFSDAGLDAYKPKFTVNIKSDKRQQEVKALLDILAKFKPTKVAIESRRQPLHDSLYTEFLNNRYQPGENEIFQIGYRLAGMMKHKRLFAIDAPSADPETMNVDSFAIAHQQQQYLDKTYIKLFFELYAKDDSLKSVLPLRTTLAYENNPERLQLGLGHYLVGDIKVAADGLYPGADQTAYWWGRNLRIFANILQLAAESKEERVFVLIGAGHLQILRWLALSCPEIEFVDAYDYLK